MLLKLKLLLVDDDTDFLEALTDYLEGKNCIVYTATTHTEALEIITRQKNKLLPIDVAIIDYILPDSNGILISRDLKQIDPDLFTVALTEHDDRESITALIHEGVFTQVISKFEPEETGIDRMIAAALCTKRLRRREGIGKPSI